MKKSIILLAILASLMLPGAGNADTFTYNGPAALNLMTDPLNTTWGISGFVLPVGQQITEVVLRINSISDTETGNSHWLFIHTLGTAITGVSTFGDTDSSPHHIITDDFQPNGAHVPGTPGWVLGAGIWVGPQAFIDAWHDADGPATQDNLVYTFSTLGLINTFRTYAADGNFGFGFDGDCNYLNQGITLTITTTPTRVPEPSILLLLGSALVGLSLWRTRKG